MSATDTITVDQALMLTVWATRYGGRDPLGWLRSTLLDLRLLEVAEVVEPVKV